MNDLRVIKTKKAIKQTFLKELSKKDISKIRITKLCEKAMINKSTFYKHYQDIDDLLRQIQNELIDELFDNFEDKDKLFSNLPLFMQGVRNLCEENEKKLQTVFKNRFEFAMKFESKIFDIYASEHDTLETKTKIEFVIGGIFRTVAKSRDKNCIPSNELFDILTNFINKLEM